MSRESRAKLRTQRERDGERLWLAGGGLVALVFVAYLPVIVRGGFIWDDDVHVTRNAALNDLGGLIRIWTDRSSTPQYYPLVHTSFWIERRIWGDNPAGYRVVNTLLHSLSAVVLWRSLARLNYRPAWVAAMVFALHPVQVESIAWITERKNVLSVLFYLLALRAYLPLIEAGEEIHASGRSRSFIKPYTIAFALFVCALLSKSVTATLPAAIALLIWWRHGRLTRRDVLPLLPMLAVAALFGLNTAYLERTQVGAIGPEWDLSFLDRTIVAGRALWFYAGKLLWPVNQVFIYPRWNISFSAWWQFVFAAAFGMVIAALWLLRSRLGRGPLVAILFFAGTLTPALGFFDVYPMRYSFVADHFQYLASIGIVVLVCAGTRVVLRDARRVRVAGAILAPLLIVLVWRQSSAYRDLSTLWRATIEKNPGSWMAHANLGVELAEMGKADDALRSLRTALSLRPDDPETNASAAVVLAEKGELVEAEARARLAVRGRPRLASAHSSLAIVLGKAGKLDEAIASAHTAVELAGVTGAMRFNHAQLLLARGRASEAAEQLRIVIATDPSDMAARRTLAEILESEQKWSDAVQQYARVLGAIPDDVEVRKRMATSLGRAGRAKEALLAWAEVLRRDPQSGEAHHQMGAQLAAQGDKQHALDAVANAVRTQPDNVRFRLNYATLLSESGKPAEALAELDEVIRLKPDLVEAHNDRAMRLAEMARDADAIDSYSRSIELRPDQADVESNLGSLLARGGNAVEAVAHFERAIRLAPKKAEFHYRLGAALAPGGQIGRAIACFEESIRLKPDYAEPMSALAELLVQTGGRGPEDSTKALDLAKRAAELTKREDPVVLATLAGATAFAGNVSEAELINEEAAALAERQRQVDLAKQIREQRSRYGLLGK